MRPTNDELWSTGLSGSREECYRPAHWPGKWAAISLIILGEKRRGKKWYGSLLRPFSETWEKNKERAREWGQREEEWPKEQHPEAPEGQQPTRSAFHMCHFLLASAGGARHGMVASGAQGLSDWHRRLCTGQTGKCRHTCIHTHKYYTHISTNFPMQTSGIRVKGRVRVTQEGVWMHACVLMNTVIRESSFR